MPGHGTDHWEPETCFGCKIHTVQVAASATPTRSPGVSEKNRLDRKLDADLSAYKRLRLDGLNPKSTEDAAKFEKRAESEYEVVSGQLAPDMAKGKDVSQGGREWRRRAEDAYQASKRGEVLVG